MFSFFKSSKKSPVVSPVAERANDPVQKSGDDFEVIPPNPSSFSPINPAPSVTPTNPQPLYRQFSVANYTQSVPFKLNPAIISENSDTEMWNFKLREMNSKLQRINLTDYDFKLERSIVAS